MKWIDANDAHTASIWSGDHDQRQYQLHDQQSVQNEDGIFWNGYICIDIADCVESLYSM